MLPEDLKTLPGIVATVVVSGYVDENFAQSLADLRSFNDRNGIHAVEYRKFPNPFVEAGRDEVIQHALNEGYAWVLMIDADAAPFPPDALLTMLKTGFVDAPNADVIGAYAQLKHPPYLPVIDTGTGTWEPHYPGEGLLPVIRTGGHFLFVKTGICRRFGPPWFRTRRTVRLVDALAEVDNSARIAEDGKNLLTTSPTWTSLVEKAKKEGGGGVSTVGEDSGFCDAVKAAGGNIYVNTNVFVGHVGKRVVEPKLLDEEMRRREEQMRGAVGVYE